MKRTPFYHLELGAGARMREVQGWEMPDEFSGMPTEHMAVRRGAGLFDWSSTGEIELQGPDALALVQRAIVNDAAGMQVGQVLYSTMCNPDGSIFSDITVYRLGPERYWVMTAWGSNRAHEFPELDFLRGLAGGLNVAITDVSSGCALLAVQGPLSREIVAQVTTVDLQALRYMSFAGGTVAGAPRSLVSRTGYTGELGFELVVPAEHGQDVWAAVMAAGQPVGMLPCGLATAFSLRHEKGYIARFDILDGVTPYEAGLGWTVKLDKGEFVGREALVRQKAEGVRRRLVTVALRDSLIPPAGCAILRDGQTAGKVTSSAFGYAVERPLALAVVGIEAATPGTEVQVQAEDGLHPAEVVRRPFYDTEGTRLRS